MEKHVNWVLSLLFDLDLVKMIHNTYKADLYFGDFVCFNDVNILFLFLFKTMCVKIACVAQF